MKRLLSDQQIEESFKVLEQGFGVNISLHDLRGTLCRVGAKLIAHNRHLHRHPCCLYKRYANSGWDELCYRDCFTQSERDSVEHGKPFIKHCWKGIGELVVPLIHEDQHQLTIYCGTFRSPETERLSSWPEDPKFKKMWRKLPMIDEDKLFQLGTLLTVLGHSLLYQADAVNEEDAGLRGAVIRRFIINKAHLPITTSDLAEHLHLSPSRTSHLVKESTGMTFQDLLLQERMLRANNLLLQSQMTLNEVASSIGLNSEFYFNRVFRSFYGMPPGKYRQTHKNPIGM